MNAVIFGTGSVALRLYQELSVENGENYISFFIDSMVKKREFCGKPVYSLNNLPDINLNDYQYYLGSISSQKSMKAELLKLGISEKNINRNRDYSEDAFQAEVVNVKTLLIYPKVHAEKKEEIKMLLTQYLGILKEKIEIDYEGRLDGRKYDLVLVWDKEHLHDSEIIENNNIFCIDDRFYPTIEGRILSRLAYIISNQEKKEEYYKNSKKILRGLKAQDAQGVYIFASGPSLENGIQIYEHRKEKNTITMVCNGFIKSGKEILKKVNPKVYLLLDILYLGSSYRELMDQIADYVKNNECYLVVPNFWIPVLMCRYQIEEKIMGLALNASEIKFPDEENMSVYNKAANVITTFGIPLASVLAKKVYFTGCDGFENRNEKLKGWEYSKLASEDVDIDLSQRDMWDYEEKHYAYFEEIIGFGEKEGINYQTITKSHIPCLKERYQDIL